MPLAAAGQKLPGSRKSTHTHPSKEERLNYLVPGLTSSHPVFRDRWGVRPFSTWAGKALPVSPPPPPLAPSPSSSSLASPEGAPALRDRVESAAGRTPSHSRLQPLRQPLRTRRRLQQEEQRWEEEEEEEGSSPPASGHARVRADLDGRPPACCSEPRKAENRRGADRCRGTRAEQERLSGILRAPIPSDPQPLRRGSGGPAAWAAAATSLPPGPAAPLSWCCCWGASLSASPWRERKVGEHRGPGRGGPAAFLPAASRGTREPGLRAAASRGERRRESPDYLFP